MLESQAVIDKAGGWANYFRSYGVALKVEVLDDSALMPVDLPVPQRHDELAVTAYLGHFYFRTDANVSAPIAGRPSFVSRRTAASRSENTSLSS